MNPHSALACTFNAIGSLSVLDAERFITKAESAAAMTLEALEANMKPYDTRLHGLRGFSGAIVSAANLRRIMDDRVPGPTQFTLLSRPLQVCTKCWAWHPMGTR